MNAFLRHIDILSKAYENERENLAQERMEHSLVSFRWTVSFKRLLEL